MCCGVSVVQPKPAVFDSFVSVKKGKNYFIPALVYWGVKESFNCNLHPIVPERIFNQACARYIDSQGLVQKLNGRRLEVTLDTVPTRFTYSYDINTIFLLFAYMTSTYQRIEPERGRLAISYKLYSGDVLEKEGKIGVGSSVNRLSTTGNQPER